MDRSVSNDARPAAAGEVAAPTPSGAATPRELRRPLFVPVVTDPPVLQCWSENISSRGIGLVGRLAGGGDSAALPEGVIELSFQLPDLSAIEAAGHVAWARWTERDGVAFGVRLDDMTSGTAQRLARFVAEFRFRVVVVGASADWRARLEEAVGDRVSLEHVDGEGDVPPFDVAAVVFCGVLPSARLDLGVFDAAPRCVAIADAADAALVEAFRQARLACALPLGADAAAIRGAIFEVCRDWSVRSELRATTLRFARELQARRQSAAGAGASGGPRARDDAGEQGLIIAECEPMQALFQQLRVVAPRKVVVLLEGETGSGKEVLAKVVHARSERAQRPLVVQDCGTLTETLLDSELFGHVRGAFTGANADHPGLFVIADGGTVFLDEIENTTPALQAKLLRVIETGQIRPVGGTRTRTVDVRVIAATNRDLRAAVDAGRFRADLYYRLSVFPIAVPPLRERGRDVLLLAERLAADAARAHGLPPPPFSDDALAVLERYRWPGNVRQLKNAMERAVLLSGGGRIELFHLPNEVREDAAAGGAAGASSAAGARASLRERVAEFERDQIVRALREAGGVVSKAARKLGANRITLTRRMRSLGIQGGDAPPS